jgi:HEAT repeat protein
MLGKCGRLFGFFILLGALFVPQVHADRIDDLVRQTMSKEGSTRYDAIRALGTVKDPRAADALIEILQSGSNENDRKYAADSLGELEGPFDPRAMGPLIKALDGDSSNQVRSAAGYAIYRYYDFGNYKDPEPLAHLHHALKDPDASVRGNAADALKGAARKNIKDPAIVPSLIQALKDSDSRVRHGAAWALGAYQDPRAVDPLILTLKDQDYLVRDFAATALGELGEPRAIEPLLELLKDPKDSVRKTVSSVLKKLGVDEARMKSAGLLPRELLNSLLKELENASSYDAFEKRERVIKLAQGITPPPAMPEEARRSLAQGNAAFKLARNASGFEEAEKHFQKAANLAPWWPDACFNLALVQERLRKFDDAIKNLNLYLFAAPHASDAESARSKIYEVKYLKERKEKAEEHYHRAVEHHENSRYKEAEAEYREAIGLDPDSGWAHAGLGAILSNQTRYKDAVVELKEAMRLDNKTMWVYTNLSYAMEKTGFSENEIIALLEEGLREGINEHQPESGLAYFNIGAAYHRKGEYRKAIEYYQKSIDKNYKNKSEAQERIKNLRKLVR